MNTIWKFPLQISDEQEIEFPEAGQLLCVDVQNEIPCLWVMVDPSQRKASFKILTFGTGHEINEDLEEIHYVGTYQLRQGALVYHVFIK